MPIPVGKVQYIKFRGEVIDLTYDGFFWRDNFGTIYGYTDDTLSLDHTTQCGLAKIWAFDPSAFPELTEACAPHDNKYSNPAFQAYHTREEADEDLERDVKLLAPGRQKLLAKPFKWLARLFGGSAWENKQTK